MAANGNRIHISRLRYITHIIIRIVIRMTPYTPMQAYLLTYTIFTRTRNEFVVPRCTPPSFLTIINLRKCFKSGLSKMVCKLRGGAIEPLLMYGSFLRADIMRLDGSFDLLYSTLAVVMGDFFLNTI